MFGRQRSPVDLLHEANRILKMPTSFVYLLIDFTIWLPSFHQIVNAHQPGGVKIGTSCGRSSLSSSLVRLFMQIIIFDSIPPLPQ